jgi:hypothetical protein
MAVLYAGTYWLGIWASKHAKEGSFRDMVLAGQRLGLGIGVCTMTATWVDGGYVNGTAEQAYGAGLLFVQAPWGYALSLIVGGLWFAPIMRRHGFTTLLDPFEQRFGKKSAALLYLPALTGEVFWTAAILTALGTTFGLILDSGCLVVDRALRGGRPVLHVYRRIVGGRHHRRRAADRPHHRARGRRSVRRARGGRLLARHGGIPGGGGEPKRAGQLVDVDRHGAAARLRRHSVARVLPARPGGTE